MNAFPEYRPTRRNPYSAKNMAKPVPFTCLAPEAAQVFIAGDFNDWHPSSHPLKRMHDGAWRIEVALNHGHHHYVFLVDGKAVLDPRANGTARNERGEKVSLIAVS